MDEYTFIILAKLKTDRLQLEREQRLAAPTPELEAERVDIHRHSARTHWSSSQPTWREQS